MHGPGENAAASRSGTRRPVGLGEPRYLCVFAEARVAEGIFAVGRP